MMNFNSNKNLVISAVGDESLHRYWKPKKYDSYDLYLIYYGKESTGHYQMRREGTKFHLIADALDTKDFSRYEYIWMPDDDIYLESSDITKLFLLAKEYDLWLCQPSIMGWYGLEMTLHQRNCLLRFTNYVEIMCPCFSQYALQKCINTFRTNKSGWGIDALWNINLEHPTNKIAVIDKLIAFHTRPIGGGDIYKTHTNNSIDNALIEAKELYHKNNLAEENYEDLKMGRVTNVESFEMLYFNTVEYGRIYQSTEAGVSVSERLWPPANMIQSFCNSIRDNSK